MFYRGHFCELDFQILDHKQCRRPHISHQIHATGLVNSQTVQFFNHRMI